MVSRLPLARLTALAAAVGFALLMISGSASARTSVNVCQGWVEEPSGTVADIACGVQVTIPGHRSAKLEAGVVCRYRVAGTQRNREGLLLRPAWDYWTQRGQWVTARRAGLYFDSSGDRVVAVAAQAHNWYLRPWPARVFSRCDATPTALAASDVAGHAVVGSSADDALTGGPRDDLEIGERGDDHLGGGAGNDTLEGDRGDDMLLGGPGDDDARGGRGHDEIRGGAGDDVLLGGPAGDELWGGTGDDELFDDEGRDALHGGAGNDRFSAKDGNADLIDCGEGVDQVVADPFDRTVGCEYVWTSEAEAPDSPPDV